MPRATAKKSKPAKAARRRVNSSLRLVGLIVLVGLIAIVAWALLRPDTLDRSVGPLSRQVNVYQQSIIKQLKPPPTLAGLQYAYVATAYNDGLKSGGQPVALAAAGGVLDTIYPGQRAATAIALKQLAAKNDVKPNQVAAQSIIDRYTQRYANDGHDAVWNGVIPVGLGKWHKVDARDPLSPTAGNWQSWNVTTAIDVPPPPAYGSAEDLRQIAIVERAVAGRNGQDINLVNFWGGTPGTETPGGIWQNQLYKTVAADLPADLLAADQQYSSVQSSTAQSISDAFIECWKIKYTYWTARPSMRITGLSTAMENPLFPSYISGHSTISKAAADTLSVTVPKYARDWQSMADDARRSRLVAGIHFDVDNAQGYVVGSEVAQQTIKSLQLVSVIN
ncbi:MAG: hypothetical protein ABIV43_02325 [Candidatus Saccharimonadales bacterium]